MILNRPIADTDVRGDPAALGDKLPVVTLNPFIKSVWLPGKSIIVAGSALKAPYGRSNPEPDSSGGGTYRTGDSTPRHSDASISSARGTSNVGSSRGSSNHGNSNHGSAVNSSSSKHVSRTPRTQITFVKIANPDTGSRENVKPVQRVSQPQEPRQCRSVTSQRIARQNIRLNATPQRHAFVTRLDRQQTTLDCINSRYDTNKLNYTRSRSCNKQTSSPGPSVCSKLAAESLSNTEQDKYLDFKFSRKAAGRKGIFPEDNEGRLQEHSLSQGANFERKAGKTRVHQFTQKRQMTMYSTVLNEQESLNGSIYDAFDRELTLPSIKVGHASLEKRQWTASGTNGKFNLSSHFYHQRKSPALKNKSENCLSIDRQLSCVPNTLEALSKLGQPCNLEDVLINQLKNTLHHLRVTKPTGLCYALEPRLADETSQPNYLIDSSSGEYGVEKGPEFCITNNNSFTLNKRPIRERNTLPKRVTNANSRPSDSSISQSNLDQTTALNTEDKQTSAKTPVTFSDDSVDTDTTINRTVVINNDGIQLVAAA